MAVNETRAVSVTLEADLPAPAFIPLVDLAPDNIIIPNQCTLAVTGTPLPYGGGRDAVRPWDGAGDARARSHPPGGRRVQCDRRTSPCAGGQCAAAGAGRACWGCMCPWRC